MNQKKWPDVIPYPNWSNSQLSVVRHYGSCQLNNERYILDFDNCEKKEVDGVEKYFPDLISPKEQKRRGIKLK